MFFTKQEIFFIHAVKKGSTNWITLSYTLSQIQQAQEKS